MRKLRQQFWHGGTRVRKEIAGTIAALCRDAHRDRGRAAAVLTFIAEWFDVIRVSVARMLGRGPAISAGGPMNVKTLRSPGRSPLRLLFDVRQAVRGLRASPATTVITVLTLALGIGINAAVFSIVDSLLLHPVPYPEQHRLVSLWTYMPGGKFQWRGGFTSPLTVEWRAQTDLFDRVEGSQDRSVVFEHEAGAELVNATTVTPGLLSMLGANARIGRVFVDGDGRDGTDRQVVISTRFWQRHLHHAPDVLERQILLDGARYQVIGVLPDHFRYPDERQDLWIPLDPLRPPSTETRPASFVLLARLRRGVTLEHATERVTARGEQLNRTAGGDGKSSASVMPVSDLLDERTERSLLVLAGAVTFLLLIVCANVASLTLSRAVSRGRDRAVRTALGASRADLAREALVEHALLGSAGAIGGIMVASMAIGAATGVLPEAMETSSLNRIDLDLRALGFLGALSVVTVFLFGLPSALLAGRGPLGGGLHVGPRAATESAAARRFRAALVVAEVALSIVLLSGAALMTRSLLKLEAIDIGLDPDRLLTMQIALPAPAYADHAMREDFIARVVARLRSHPSVIAATAGALPPREHLINVGAVEVGDRPGEKTKSSAVPVFEIRPGYFATAGIRLVEGREPNAGDPAGAAVVSQGFAAAHWPGQSPLGRRFRIGKGPWRSVVGVATEVRARSEREQSREFELYYPRGQAGDAYTSARPVAKVAEYLAILLRTSGAGVKAEDLARLVHDIDPRVIVGRTSLVSREFADAIARPRIVFLIMSIFAGFGLLLAAAGLYGVLSHLVSQRLREIGIRLALGASPRAIGRVIVGSGLGLTAAGIVIGLVVALGLVRTMQALLYEVEPADFVSFAAVCAIVIVTAAIAAWRPAGRAMRVDPVTLLREE